MTKGHSQSFRSVFVAYVIGLAGLVALGAVPSNVESHYSVLGTVLMLALVIGFGLGSKICRVALAVLGGAVSLGTLLGSEPSPDALVVLWCLLCLGVTGLLFTTPARNHNRWVWRRSIS